MKNLISKAFVYYMRYKVKRELDFPFDNKISKPSAKKSYLLYSHIPFCKTLCPYCSFHKYLFKEDNAREYFKYLRKEISLAKEKGFEFHSLYIGGGTPTILADELVETIDLVKSLWEIKEVSCEADPDIESIDLLSTKIDRLSVGIQSFNDDILKKTKRYKKFGSAKEQFDKVKKLVDKFKIVNCDLIFGFPKQTKEQLLYDLKRIKELGATQVSIYPLMHSPSVKKAIERSMGSLERVDEFGFYKVILKELESDYEQISCWSFAKSEKSVFDEYVVDEDEYLGLGSGAFSFIDDSLYINEFSLNRYANIVDRGELSMVRSKKFSKKNLLYYRLMLEMFGLKFDKESFYNKYGLKNELDFELFLLRLFGMLDKNDSLTLFGKYMFMIFLKEFYIGMDYVREVSRKGIDKYGMNIKSPVIES